MVSTYRFIVPSALALLLGLSSCYDPKQKADAENLRGDDQGTEYAPQMYHSEAYEPLTQITEESAGTGHWMGVKKDGTGEFYNSNPHNPHKMNMRLPVSGTVKRGYKPYHISRDSIDAAAGLVSPFIIETESRTDENGQSVMGPSEKGAKQLAECEALYISYCSHCHGKTGQADGKVAEKFGGVPMYNSAAIKDKSIGHIYHVITHGKGRMGAHGSQILPMDRWKIATWVQTLQKK